MSNISRFTTASSSWHVNHDDGTYLRVPLTDEDFRTHPYAYAGVWESGRVDGPIEYYERVHFVGLDAVWSGAVLSIDGVPAPPKPRADKIHIDEHGYTYDADLFTLLQMYLEQHSPTPTDDQAVRDAAYRQQLGVRDDEPLPKVIGSAKGQGRSTDFKHREEVKLNDVEP